jgi:5-methylcytosine-specific restriction endonuclease McrBC GTP-binding regulatory subunit McrB
MDYIDSKITLLEKSKNLILTGAPGTGKTYLARQMAMKMIANKTEEKNLSPEEGEKFKNQCRFVQFHPSYDYTDFVEGLRPTKPDEQGNIGFELKNGIFKKFCKDALAARKEDEKNKVPVEKRRKFIFIIDEINRGEISKIFGELFFSIDPGYRGTEGRVQTQYANIQSNETETIFDTGEGQGWFYVPENVYIIGTMNDIDRSVESFDFAMRRRFVWEEVTAKESYSNMGLENEGAYENSLMKKLNDVIQNIPGLNSSYHIGGQYFLNINEEDESILWKLRLKPLLREYLRGLDAKEYRDIVEKSESVSGFLKSFGSKDSGNPEK